MGGRSTRPLDADPTPADIGRKANESRIRSPSASSTKMISEFFGTFSRVICVLFQKYLVKKWIFTVYLSEDSIWNLIIAALKEQDYVVLVRITPLRWCATGWTRLVRQRRSFARWVHWPATRLGSNGGGSGAPIRAGEHSASRNDNQRVAHRAPILQPYPEIS
jgi:hypothetical protein